jgi:2-methylcitrate dehydratase PrpD
VETVSSSYADFILSTHYHQLKPEVIQQVKKLILDLIGVSLAGYRSMEFPRTVVQYMEGLGGAPEAIIFQTKKKFPAINSVFANATCAHAIDMDDGHRFGALHPGTVIIPVALAATELYKASTKDLITGVVVGYEVMIRVGAAINPSSLNRGFHATGITGTFGAAAAAASIMKLGRDEIIGALGMAGLQSAGVLQINHDVEGAKVKPINPARAATSGLFSCIMAQRGAKGPRKIFEGEDGFLKAFTDEVKKDLLTKDLGKTFEICNTYIKLYAACRHVHACVDAALQAFERNPIEISEIKKISVETYPVAIRLCGITEVTTPSAARFSIPFSVALALVKKDAGTDKYVEENICDESIQRLSRKVDLSVDSKWEKLYPEKRGATVRIIDQMNREWASEVDLAKGEPENPVSWKELYSKFFLNATLLLPEDEVQKIGEVIMNLDCVTITDLTNLI